MSTTIILRQKTFVKGEKCACKLLDELTNIKNYEENTSSYVNVNK